MKCCTNLTTKKLKPVMVMVLVQMAFAGMTILYKMADEEGMNLEVLVSYRMMFSSAFMIPFALIVERRSKPPLTWFTLFQAFVCGLLGQKYPCCYSSTALICRMASVQSVVFALCIERDWSQWKLGWNIRLLTAAYSVPYDQVTAT
ncbi:hypothetical protein L6164_036264 [Bauhinia variegata]|uniref:Uncharacterized protein n=1 Tax=Bauhinia variegata TaxID=167791 RepID=A0ACB9KGI8_BAUVA|nr:hypothetical protein L6164_036264 [Bauhinia variegata]